MNEQEIDRQQDIIIKALGKIVDAKSDAGKPHRQVLKPPLADSTETTLYGVDGKASHAFKFNEEKPAPSEENWRVEDRNIHGQTHGHSLRIQMGITGYCEFPDNSPNGPGTFLKKVLVDLVNTRNTGMAALRCEVGKWKDGAESAWIKFDQAKIETMRLRSNVEDLKNKNEIDTAKIIELEATLDANNKVQSIAASQHAALANDLQEIRRMYGEKSKRNGVLAEELEAAQAGKDLP